MDYYSWDLKNDNVVAITTTSSLGNLAFQTDNDSNAVLKRREKLAALLNIPYKSFTYVHQHHSDIILEVKKEDIGKGGYSFESGLECDALYTKEKNIPLCIFHADCVPIFFFVPNKLVGIIHSGHKGTKKEITLKSLKFIIEKENINPNDLFVFIGPSRKFFSYIIDKEEEKEIIGLGYKEAIKETKTSIYFDVPFMNYMMIRKAGIPASNIAITDVDTFENPNLYSAFMGHKERVNSIIYIK